MEAKRLEDLNAAASAADADDETKARYGTPTTTKAPRRALVPCPPSPVGVPEGKP